MKITKYLIINVQTGMLLGLTGGWTRKSADAMSYRRLNGATTLRDAMMREGRGQLHVEVRPYLENPC